jgi:transposase
VHRALVGQGLVNQVIDSASIEVNRRARRTKTDRIDARKLVALLVRVAWGETGAFRTVRVPSAAEEAARQASRERTALVADQTRLVNQLRSLLALQGTKLPARRVGAWYRDVVDWAGAPLSSEVQELLARATDRLRQLQQQIAAIEAQQAAAVEAAPATSAAGRLVRLRGVGPTGTVTLLGEGLEWRAFRNRREIGGLLGFAPTHHASGELQRNQGISRAGNHRLQSVMVQLGWSWIRRQPKSELTRWFKARFGTGQRLRRIGIVALARKLLIALWRYATQGIVPAGAELKA